MQREALLYGIIGLLSGIILTVVFVNILETRSHSSMMQMMGGTMMDQHHSSDMSMDDMNASLEGKSGDQFDAAFITSMIEHHQGAIDMAELAQKNAKHDEIKNMAGDIISAQSAEIEQMEGWRETWGYAASGMMGH